MKKPVARLDLAVALALRIGLYQLRFLQRIPARAAVNESVELVKSARKTSAASLVNAVLRKSAAEASAPAAQFLQPELPTAERLSILHSHPRWMVERWLARWGEPRTVALLEANNRAPRLSGAVHDPAQRETILAELKSAGLKVEDGRLLRAAFAVSGGSPAATAAFRAGQNLHPGRGLAGCRTSARRSRRRPRARSLRRSRRQDHAARASRRAPGNRGRRRPASPPAARDASATASGSDLATFNWRISTPPKNCLFPPALTGFWSMRPAPAPAPSRATRKSAGGFGRSNCPSFIACR